MDRFFFINKIIIFLIIICSPVYAELVIGIGEKIHDPDLSQSVACNIALERAKQDAHAKSSIGVESSVEIFNKCSEIDGELECERNQLSILRSKGQITDYKQIDKEYDKYKDTELYYCKITIKAEVKPIEKLSDIEFHFETKLNNCLKIDNKYECNASDVFRSGEIMRVDIDTNVKMHMYIFQWLPYAKTAQITKVFPNENYPQKITDNLISGKQSLFYTVNFPENIFKKRMDEYLILVGSKKSINFLDEYDKIERLYKHFIKPNLLVEKSEIGYIVINK